MTKKVTKEELKEVVKELQKENEPFTVNVDFKPEKKTEQIKIRTLQGKSRIMKLDDKFWDNLLCVLGFSEKFIIYRKKGRPSEIYHYEFTRDFANMVNGTKNESVEQNLEELRKERPKELGYSQSYSCKSNDLSYLFNTARERELLLMTFYEESVFIERGLHYLYERHRIWDI